MPHKRPPVLAFDIGGTNIRAGIADWGSAALVRTARCPTPNFLTHPDMDGEALVRAALQAMGELGRALTEGRPPAAVVVGWPGPIAPDGTVLRSPTILGAMHDRPMAVRALLAPLWPGSEIAVLNDLTCAGYAYVGLGYRDFCIVTVGSGIANKVFVDGRPLLGPGGRGGEIGHLAARPIDGVPRGVLPRDIHLGDLASGRGTLSLGHRLAIARPALFAASPLAASGDEFDNEALVAAFHAGDPFARRVVDISAGALAHALASVHLTVGTERIILTGGFATALGSSYRRLLVTHAESFTWSVGQDWNAMIELGEEVDGLQGAAVFGWLDLLREPLENVA